MQNLTLQAAQSSKNTADKSNLMADKFAEEPSLSFQTLLKQQVKTHQGQQKSLQKTSDPEVAEVLAKDVLIAQDSVDLLAVANVASVEAVNVGSDNNPQIEAAANGAADVNLLGLNVPVSAPLMWSSVTSAKTLSNAQSGQLDAQTSAVIGEMLNNAMSQDKGLQLAVPTQSNSKIEQPIPDGKLATEQTRWLDIMPQGAAKQSVEINPKLMTEVVSDKTKSSDIKLADIKMADIKTVDVKTTDIKSLELPVNQISAPLQTAQNMAPRAVEQLATSNNIYAYPGKTGWDQAISQKVMWMVGAGEQSATLTLNPPDLGPLQVVISVNNDKADTTFISNNAEVRQALQDGMANLREKMSESGLQLGQTSVNSGNQNQQTFQPASKQTSASQRDNDSPVVVEEKMNRTSIRVSNGLVDTFV
jgi:flagellar hook-length control protein FliK